MYLWRHAGLAAGCAVLFVLAVITLSSLDLTGTVVKLDIEQLTERSERIVDGQVVKLQSYWEAGRIFTDVTIAVSSYLKGSGSTEVVIPIPGGTVGEIVEVVSDVPQFQQGQEVILFLRQEYFEIVGWYQGKFTVEDGMIVETGQQKSTFVEEVAAIESTPDRSAEKGQLGPSIREASEVFDASLYMHVEPSESNDTLDGKVGDDVGGVEDRAVTTIKTEGFEGAWPNTWNVYAESGYSDVYWGDEDSGPIHSGSWSGYCADSGSEGVEPPGPYPSNMKTWMIYGPFSLADATSANLLFYHWTKTEKSFDKFEFMASINGVNYYGTALSGDWVTTCGGFCYRNFDLTSVYTLGNLCGQPQVWIAFIFTSDGSIEYEGTYIDDITLQKNVATPPVISSISPASGPAHAVELSSTGCAADSTLVTLNGSGFGASQGTSYVRFWRDGSTYYNGCVVSWSDTQILVRVPGRVSSGNILVHKDAGGDSNTKYFTVTYSYGGGRWPGPSPMRDTDWTDQQFYYVNPNTTDTTGELAATQAAANTWNYVGNADFSFRYGGTTTTAAVDFDDHRNVVFWNPSDTGSIATNHSWWYTSDTHTLVQFDIEFNDSSHVWATDGSSGGMDVQNVATHEFGHSLSLLDLYGSADTEKTMYGYASNGVTKQRTLHLDDIAGIHYIYPSAGTPAVFRVEAESGNVLADATFHGAGFLSGSADVAEWVNVSGPVEAGDVLELDPQNPGHYRKSSSSCSDLVAGVVSTQPGVLLGASGAVHSSPLPVHAQALLALVGIVPVKACAENGPIRVGDLLVASSTPGYAMRWSPEDGPCGHIVGKALEELVESEGLILALLTR